MGWTILVILIFLAVPAYLGRSYLARLFKGGTSHTVITPTMLEVLKKRADREEAIAKKLEEQAKLAEKIREQKDRISEARAKAQEAKARIRLG